MLIEILNRRARLPLPDRVRASVPNRMVRARMACTGANFSGDARRHQRRAENPSGWKLTPTPTANSAKNFWKHDGGSSRGVRVQCWWTLVGSWLCQMIFQPLIDAGAECAPFNPWNFWRFGVRDHRKMLICDDHVAFIADSTFP